MSDLKDAVELIGRVASLDREVFDRIPKLFDKAEAAMDKIESESRARDDRLRDDMQLLKEDLAGFRGKVDGFTTGVNVGRASVVEPKSLPSGKA